MGALDAFVHAFDAAAADAPAEPAGVARSRREALEALLRGGLPTRHAEDWKYTSLRLLDTLNFSTAASPGHLTVDGLRQVGALIVDDCLRLVFVDGHFDAALSHLDGLPPHASLAPWSAGVAQSPAPASEALCAAARGGAFDAINRMFARDGMVLELADGACLAAPIIVIMVQTGAGAGHARHVLRLGQDASARVVEQHIALAQMAPYLSTSVTRAELARAANLAHVRLQDESGAAVHVSQLHVAQGGDSVLDAQALVLGARLSRQEVHVEHGAPGCRTALRGASMLGAEQHGDVQMRIEHRHPLGTSRTDVRGVFDDAAHGVFSGRVNVHPDAQKTDAGMINRNLLLSPRAEADTRPQLQIDADDVLCSHGATVGQLDAEALFYLLSRGVAPQDARAMLVQAFIAAALPDIGWEPLRAHVRARLAARQGLVIDAPEVPA